MGACVTPIWEDFVCAPDGGWDATLILFLWPDVGPVLPPWLIDYPVLRMATQQR